MSNVSWAPRPAKTRVFKRWFHRPGRMFSHKVPFTLVREELFKTREKAVAAANRYNRHLYFAIVEMRYYPDATKTHVSGSPAVRGYALYRASVRDVRHIESKLNLKYGGGIRMEMSASQFW